MTECKDFILRGTPADAAACGQETAGRDADSAATRMPRIDFCTFVLSLNAAAMVHLGIMHDPLSQEQRPNLPLGKQTIDTLAMLAEKTRGNLTADEEALLTHVLTDLRLNYVRQKR